MSRIFFTSDLHFGHQMVAGLRGFDDPEDHDEAVAERWCETIDKRDVVYVLGDLCLSRPDDALSIIGKLPGAKHFISGNHDACHPMHRKWRAMQARYQTAFETVQPFGTVRIGGTTVLLSHFPYTDDHVTPPRYMQWRLPNHGQWLIHGHTHDATQRRHGKEIHVGADAWDLKPVSAAEVEAMMHG